MKTLYKGFIINREPIGRCGTVFQFSCGEYRAPRKKDVKRHIDELLERQSMIDIEFNRLEKSEIFDE